MRKVVVVEGKLLPNGMMLAKGALKDPGKPVPVTMEFDPLTIVGKATGFERNEESGEISFDIQFSPEYAGGEDLIEDSEVCLSAYSLEIDGDILIESAKVGAAIFMPFSGIPKVVADLISISKDETASMEKAALELIDLVNSGYVKVPEEPIISKPTAPGLLGVRPSRRFKIFREEFPAIFRFNGKLYQEEYDIDNDESRWVEISETYAMRWLEAKKPDA